MHCMLTTAARSQGSDAVRCNSSSSVQFVIGIGTKSSCFEQLKKEVLKIVLALSILAMQEIFL